MDPTEVTRAVREFIVGELEWSGDPALLTDEYPLIDEDVIDSLAIMEIVTFVEEHFGITIDDEELVADHFATLDSIARFVDAKAPV